MANARVTRGRKTQELLAAYYRENGWPDAEAVAASLPGRDIKNMLGLAPEVKATAGQDFTGALRQATLNAGFGEVIDMPFVVYRPNGYGPEKIRTWIVAMNLGWHTLLLKEAGYGSTD